MRQLSAEEIKTLVLVGKLSNRQKAYRAVARLRDNVCGYDSKKEDVGFTHSFDNGFELYAKDSRMGKGIVFNKLAKKGSILSLCHN